MGRLVQHTGQRGEELGDLRLGDHQRRGKPDQFWRSGVDEEPGIAGRGLNGFAFRRGQCDTAQQTAAAHMVDEWVAQ